MAQVFKINDIKYECEFKLKNADDQELEITKSAIRGMTIDDNIFDPFVSGTISIANPFDMMENEYFFRGDGRDEFTVKFKPEGEDDDKGAEFEFIVIDDADSVNPNTRGENIKTLVLIDKHARPFLEKIPYNLRVSGKIGDIIKDTLFKKLLGDDSVHEDDWESGDFELTYTPPVNWRYIDLLNFLLQNFYVKDGDLVVKAFLRWDGKLKKFNFHKITKIFEDNKELVKESFSLAKLIASQDVSTDNPSNPPPDAESDLYSGTLRNLGYSTPFYSINNNIFVNALIHTYNPILGSFEIYKIDIKELKERWKRKFVDCFKSIGGKPKPAIVLNKASEQKYKHYFLKWDAETNRNLVESELVNSLIFYNLQTTFRNVGNSDRSAGEFVDIYSASKEQIKSEEKILGRWLITSIRHIFFADLYTNEFMCCKTYFSPQTEVKDDVE